MSDTRPPDDNDVDPGEPIAELATLEEPTTTGFADRVFRSIDRRMFGADVIDFGRRSLLEMFVQYWTFITSLLSGQAKDKGGAQQ